jgi:hypothetical protein
VREQRDLDEARLEKQEWGQRTTDLLARMFTNGSVADQFNDWVATILPEYAELNMFVELFDDEMKHRLGRLAAIAKTLKDIPEPTTVGAASMPATMTEPAQTNPALAPEPSAQPASQHPATIESILSRAIGAPEVSAPLPPRERRSSIFAHRPPSATLMPTGTTTSPAATPQTSAPAGTIASPSSPASRIIARPSSATTSPPAAAAHGASNTGLLVVRAPDDAARDSISQFLQKLGLKIQTLDRTGSPDDRTGPSLLDAVSCATPVDFVLLLTASAEQPNPDGDSLFDLGCCVGRFGAARVIVLHRGGEGHVDRFGLNHVVFDATDGWQLALARQLRKGGIELDLNRLV